MLETIIELVAELFGAIIEASDNRKLILLFLGLIIVAGGVGLFFYFNK
jgi:hypothetical protein